MIIEQIKAIRTDIDKEYCDKKRDSGCIGIHESIFRSRHIVEKVKELIERWDSIDTIREIILTCERD